MDEKQRAELGKRFPAEYLAKRIISLDIPDVFAREDARLIQLLEKQMAAAIQLI